MRDYGYWVHHPEHSPLGEHSPIPLTDADKRNGWTEVALQAAEAPTPTPEGWADDNVRVEKTDGNGQVVLGLCKKCGKGECELTNEDGSPSACSPHSTIPTDGWHQEDDLLYRSDEKGSNCDEIWVKQFGGARTMAARKDGAAELLTLITCAARAQPEGPWSLGEQDGNWRDIDHTSHGGVIRIVWAMEEDDGEPNPKLRAQAHAVVAALNAMVK